MTGWRDAFAHERIVAVHARLRPARRHGSDRRFAFIEAAIGLGLLARADRVPPDDLQLVLAPRGRWSRSSRCARARRRPRGGCSSSRTAPATSTSSTRCGSDWMQWFAELVGDAHVARRARVLPLAQPEPLVDHGGGHGARRRRAPPRGARTSRSRPRPALCIRSGFLALREIADFFGFDHDPDPSPDDPISIAQRRVHRDLRAARGGGPAGAGRPRAGVARLRGLAGQLRPRAARAVPAW